MQVVYQNQKPIVRLTETEKKALDKAIGILAMIGSIETYKTQAASATDGLKCVLEAMKPKEEAKAK